MSRIGAYDPYYRHTPRPRYSSRVFQKRGALARIAWTTLGALGAAGWLGYMAHLISRFN